MKKFVKLYCLYARGLRLEDAFLQRRTSLQYTDYFLTLYIYFPGFGKSNFPLG